MSEQRPTIIRIATWNLERPQSVDEPRVGILRQKMQDIDADVWILTETHREVSPGAEYESMATEAIEQGFASGEHRTMIWSRLPVKAAVPTQDPETAVCVELEAHGDRLLVYGTIIPYQLLPPVRRFTGPVGQTLLDFEVGSCTTSRLKGITQRW